MENFTKHINTKTRVTTISYSWGSQFISISFPSSITKTKPFNKENFSYQVYVREYLEEKIKDLAHEYPNAAIYIGYESEPTSLIIGDHLAIKRFNYSNGEFTSVR